ncbi:hypothetical protein D9V37_19740 [Nocardioides mangrovicus]|uniref:Type II secretion system protein GspF domain-containing protein n=1 Tax=Nocardioides mangrovicus TaxID=2478913 RepID=A0A3L8P104_9ACTN|nr:type II secretion system F family protein [Nocardioides mangrovicus]RLV48279.1 hypothetical protein D9V37_19740 [Nocardioides mangrovicus]
MTASVLLAAVSAGAAMGLWSGPRRTPAPVAPDPRQQGSSGWRPRWWSRWWALPVPALAAVAAAVVVGGRLPVLAAIGVGVALGVRRLLLARARSAAANAAAEDVSRFCEAVAAELAAGSPAGQALQVAADETPGLASLATAADLGADVPAAMRALAEQPGRHDLRVVAAAWQVALRSGGGLADPLQRAAVAVRERRRTARLVQAELAPARATAWLMAALPAVFLMAGSGLGGHPLSFLLGTPLGLGCAGTGLLLSYLGLAWLERIAATVEQAPG